LVLVSQKLSVKNLLKLLKVITATQLIITSLLLTKHQAMSTSSNTILAKLNPAPKLTRNPVQRLMIRS